MKTYVLTLAKTFPAGHKRAGALTWFHPAFSNAQMCAKCKETKKGLCMGECVAGRIKLHTIRGNWEQWEKRFKDIEAGNACLSVRQWEDKPYRSKMVEIARLTKEDGIGLQRIDFLHCTRAGVHIITIDGKPCPKTLIARNDGLELQDWEEWFKDCDINKPLTIIHFTKYRY